MIPKSESSRSRSFVFVETLVVNFFKSKGAGERFDIPQKGLDIINGKKVIVK